VKKILDSEGVGFCSANRKVKLRRSGVPSNSQKYKDFRKEVAILSKMQSGGKLEKPYRILIQTESMLDIDNSLKPILDGLQDSSVIQDDRHILDLRVIHSRNKKNKLKISGQSITEYVSVLQENLSIIREALAGGPPQCALEKAEEFFTSELDLLKKI